MWMDDGLLISAYHAGLGQRHAALVVFWWFSWACWSILCLVDVRGRFHRRWSANMQRLRQSFVLKC